MAAEQARDARVAAESRSPSSTSIARAGEEAMIYLSMDPECINTGSYYRGISYFLYSKISIVMVSVPVKYY